MVMPQLLRWNAHVRVYAGCRSKVVRVPFIPSLSNLDINLNTSLFKAFFVVLSRSFPSMNTADKRRA